MLKKKRSLLYDFVAIISFMILSLITLFAYRVHNVESKVLEQGLENVSGQINHHLIESVNYTENVLSYMGHQIGRHNNPKDYNYILDLFQSLAQNQQLTESLSWTLDGKCSSRIKIYRGKYQEFNK